MPTIRILYSSLLAVALLTQPAFAQNKAAIGKSASEFFEALWKFGRQPG